MNDVAMNERADIMSEWRTITQVAEDTDIPSETVRRYVRQYGDFLITKRGQRRAYLVNSNSIDTIQKIRYLLEQGHQKEQIDEILQQTEAINVQTNDKEMNDYMLTLPQLHRQMSNEINELGKQNLYQLKELEEMNKRNEQLIHAVRELTELLKEQEKKSNERDEQMKEIQSKLDNKAGFFSRLFKK